MPPSAGAPEGAAGRETSFYWEWDGREGDEEGDEEEGEGSGVGQGHTKQRTTVYEDFHLHKSALALPLLHFFSVLLAARNWTLQHPDCIFLDLVFIKSELIISSTLDLT